MGHPVQTDGRTGQRWVRTSLCRCCSQLHRNVPNRQLNKWSMMVIRKCSLNSKAFGNCNDEVDIKAIFFGRLYYYRYQVYSFITCKLTNLPSQLILYYDKYYSLK